MDFTYTTVASAHPSAVRSPSAHGAALSRTILRLIFVLSSGGFLLQLARADMYGFSSSNYVPRVRPDFDTADIPCDLSRPEGACALPGKAYPWLAINSYIEDNKAMLKRMYGDTCDRPGQHARLRAQGPMRQARGKEGDKADVGFVNACPSEQFVVTPFWANNSAGTTLAVVNFHPFEQAVQQEVCKPGTSGRCRDGCRCEQKYSWYRLLAFDPRNECRGIFMDWFQFPSCCACHCYEVDPSTKAETHPDLPLPKMGPLTTPAPTTNATIDTEIDYENDTTEAPVATTTATTIPTTSATTKVTTVTANLTSTALTTASSSSPAPTPSHATGYLKFPYTAYNRTDYISLAKSNPNTTTIQFKHRSAALSKAPPTTPLPLAPTDPGALTTPATTPTIEGADNTINSGEMWKAGDPALRKNRIPRI